MAGGKNAVENNFLGPALKGAEKGAEFCLKIPACQGAVVATAVSLGLPEDKTQDILNAVSDFIEPKGLSFEDLQKMSPEEIQALLDNGPFNSDSKVVNFFKNLFSSNNELETTIAIDPNDERFKLEGYPIPEPFPPLPPLIPPENIVPNDTAHDGGLNDIEIKHDTGGNQIIDTDWRDYIYTSEITRSEHAEIRNKEGRPVGQVINDIENSKPSDILVQEDGRWVILGPKGRVHIIEADGEHVTSMEGTNANTQKRIKDGRWVRPNGEKLQEFRSKFSDYFKR